MTTAEKRAELAEAGEPWPECECHGVAMKWNPNKRLHAKGRFACRVAVRKSLQKARQARIEAEVCIQCQSPDLETSTLCVACTGQRQERQWRYDQDPGRQLRKYLVQTRRRLRLKDSQPTGVGRAAMAAYLDQNGRTT